MKKTLEIKQSELDFGKFSVPGTENMAFNSYYFKLKQDLHCGGKVVRKKGENILFFFHRDTSCLKVTLCIGKKHISKKNIDEDSFKVDFVYTLVKTPE
jgi:hypothetical protein